jgi:tagatose-1,6-bisphosphate aldolase
MEDFTVDINYCAKQCATGIAARRKFLEENNSALDAAFDFRHFAEKCFEKCPIQKSLKVCCISAKARHGKDTAAEILKEHLEQLGKKVLITHYADLVKFVCTNYFDWDGEKNAEGRSLLQEVGTDRVGSVYPSFWVDFIVSILKVFKDKWDYVLIPDCRYPIEAARMKEHYNTKVLRVERPGFDNGLTSEQKQHPSETVMDDYQFDAIVYNDGSLEEFKEKLYWFAENFLLGD